MNEMGPWDKKPDLDCWRTDTWVKWQEIPVKTRIENGKEIVLEKCVAWQWDWVPRTCSFCGSVHPDDVVRLIGEGWFVEIAKGYKIYLHPPGYEAAYKARIRQIRGEIAESEVPKVWSPFPCVKAYSMHASQEQRDVVNRALDNQRTRNN